MLWFALLPFRFANANDRPPNIILIMADDSTADNYGCYGSTFFATPNLDNLAQGGAKFNHCYSEPVCTSSRVKIMTGRDGIRNYVAFGTLDRSETTFGTMMKKAGYVTAVAGKWQLHGEPNGSLAPECGFDSYCLWNYPRAKASRYWKPTIIQDGQGLETSERDYGPDIFTDYVIDFCESNQDRTAGNQTEAARLLGISRRTLMNRMDRLGIRRPRKGPGRSGAD